jgi:hypothetical protein
MAQCHEAPELQHPVAENVAVVVENLPQPAHQAPPDLPAQDLQAASPVVAQQQPHGELKLIDHGAFLYTIVFSTPDVLHIPYVCFMVVRARVLTYSTTF